jgi:hypothetical protein
MKKKILCIFVCMLFFVTISSVTGTMNFTTDSIDKTNIEKCPSSSSVRIESGFVDILFEYDVQTATGDTGCLGVEFDGTYFWVTGRDSPHDNIHKLHKFDSAGNHIISYEQGTISDWGWRDLAWDGAYLYAADEDGLVKIDPLDGDVVELLTGPEGITVCRGLAVNADNGHFFTANWDSPIFEFNPADGSIYNLYTNTYSIYGLAYDDFSDGGPFLWVYSQDPDVNPQVQISQFDLNSGTYTDVIYQGYWNPGYTNNLAGGACFYVDGSDPVFVGLTQSSPDTIFGMNITNLPPNSPTIDGPNSGSTKTSYDFIFNAVDPDGDDVKYIINWGDTTSTTTDFNASGVNVTVSHSWNTKDTYVIIVKAEDEYGLLGPEATFEVTIPRNKALSSTHHAILFMLLERFPILKHLLVL